MLLTKSKSLLKVVIKVLVKKLLFIFDELIMLILSSTTSLIHKPFLLITAKYSYLWKIHFYLQIIML